MIDAAVTRRVVTDFLDQVRSGRDVDRAAALMAPRVRAHQVCSEDEVTIERSPADYAEHVRQINSVVYHVENGVITEYWIQIDRAGVAHQLA
jgi:hypothetical protein